MKRKVFEKIEKHLREDGSVSHEYSTCIYSKTKEPDYIKLYIDGIDVFNSMTKTTSSILMHILKTMTYANTDMGQVVEITAWRKKIIADSLDIKINTIDKTLMDLVKSNILKKIGRGIYQVNPNIFGKGEWKNINSLRENFNSITPTEDTNSFIDNVVSILNYKRNDCF